MKSRIVCHQCNKRCRQRDFALFVQYHQQLGIHRNHVMCDPCMRNNKKIHLKGAYGSVPTMTKTSAHENQVYAEHLGIYVRKPEDPRIKAVEAYCNYHKAWEPWYNFNRKASRKSGLQEDCRAGRKARVKGKSKDGTMTPEVALDHPVVGHTSVVELDVTTPVVQEETTVYEHAPIAHEIPAEWPALADDELPSDAAAGDDGETSEPVVEETAPGVDLVEPAQDAAPTFSYADEVRSLLSDLSRMQSRIHGLIDMPQLYEQSQKTELEAMRLMDEAEQRCKVAEAKLAKVRVYYTMLRAIGVNIPEEYDV